MSEADLIIKAADLSECGNYRYGLIRVWDEFLPSLSFVMLNPSTADADLDDPTIRRCMGFARRDGFGGIVVANLFGLRSTDPMQLGSASDPVGPKNEGYLFRRLKAAQDGATKIVCAWGAHRFIGNKAVYFIGHAKSRNVPLYCLGKTKDGHPKHPLYIKGDQPLERFA